MRPTIRRLLPAVGLIVVALSFLVGINWGLPSRSTDIFLFGDPERAWTGKQIIDLAGAWDDAPERGADVDVNPVAKRSDPVVLNATDAQRAEIVRRYRLFSYQPDEMITFRALAQMHPGEGRLDPRLYQYGGLWVYPVGALLKTGSVLGLVRVRSDLAFYLDHPEEFGRFYVVARLYSAAWGVVGAWAVYRLVRRIVPLGAPGCRVAPPAAAACFAAMPVVVNMAHEAKPHLAGAVLMLLAVLAASRYVQTGRRRDWLAAGALCGAAFGMVLSALPVFVVLPLMTLLRRDASWRERFIVTAGAAAVGIVVYCVTNPYVPIHLIRRDPVLASNLGNSAAMYSAGGSAGALLNAASLIAEGTSPFLAAAGVVATMWLGIRAVRRRHDHSPQEDTRRAAGLLLVAPAALVAVQFVALAAGKPGEYGRFAILPDTVLAIESVVAVATFIGRPRFRHASFAALLVSTVIFSAVYLLRFIDDCYGTTTRLRAAAELTGPSSTPIAVQNEPAPYSLPPVNLFDRKIILLPRDGGDGTFDSAMLQIRPVDDPGREVADGNTVPIPRPSERAVRSWPARISWAGKTFELKYLGPKD